MNLSWSPSGDNVGVTGYRIERCTGASCTNFLEIGNSSSGARNGPLRVSTQNPRYFMDTSGRAILLGGSQTWPNLVDVGLSYPPPAFDYTRWLDFLTAHHHNFFRLWADSLTRRYWLVANANPGPWYTGQHPWLRTGPGNANDGRPKFDLNQFDESYFARMRLRIQQANARGIFVSVMMFDGFHVQVDRRGDGDGYPLTGSNNINGVNDGGGTRSQDLSQTNPAVLAAQEAYVRKVIDTVNDLPNVLYEIANEAGSYSTTWQQHFIAYINNYQATKPQRHPVGFTFQYAGGTDSTLYASGADWVSPAERYPSNNGTRKVLINDTDHSAFWVPLQQEGPGSQRDFVWKNFTAGNSAMFMDPFLLPWNQRNNPSGCNGDVCTTTDPQWDPIRQNIGYMLDYANTKLDLARMLPRGSLSSTGNCLANAVANGAEYLVYTETGGSFTVDLRATTRPLAVEWLNPVTGAITSAGTVTGGSASQSFTAPFSGKAVLYLSDVAGHPTPTGTSFNDTTASAGTAYRYRVRAVDGAGNLSTYSNIAGATTPAGPDTQAPSAPTGLTASTASASQINLSWSASTDNVGVTGYRVERCAGAGCANFTQVATPTATTFNNTGLAASTSYSYRVRAVDGAGNLSGYSSVATAATQAGPPGAGPVAAYNFNQGTGSTLTDSSGNSNSGTITGATWTGAGRNGGALSFDGVNDRVFVSASSTLNVTSAVTLEAWVFPTGAQSGWRAIVQKEVDAYLLHASNSAGPLRPAAGGTFNGVHLPSMSAPSSIPVNTWTHLAMTYDGSMLRLYVNGLEVASTARSGPIETNSSPLWIGGNAPYGEYFLGRIDDVRVYGRALSAAEIQADMNAPVAPDSGSDAQAPTAPSGASASASSASQIAVNWSASTDNVGVTGYRVERCAGAGCTSFAQVGTPSGTSFADSGLAASTSYNYRIRAVDAAGNLSGYSNTASATTQTAADTQAPTAPSGAGATATSASQINLNWTASTDNVGVTGYRVERCAGAGCTSFAQVGTPSGTSFSNTGLSAATTYNYRVRAVDAAGNLSAYSNTTSATTQSVGDSQAPTAPAGASATAISTSQITLSWTASTDNVGVSGYRVERCTGSGCSNFAQIGTPTGTSFTDSALTASTSYSYRVRATDAAGNLSSYSNTASATTQSASGGAPVAAYNFDEGTGSTLSDASGNANTGAITGATWTSAGKNGGALNFDGVNDRVFVNASSSLNMTNGATLEAWVYPTGSQSGWRAILQKEVDAYLLHASNSAGALHPAAGGTFNGTHPPSMSAPNAIPVNTWTHLAMTYDGAMLRVFVNGTQVASTARSGNLEANSNPLWIGGNSPYGEYFLGRIDDVRVYRRALSAAEIQTDMNTPVASSSQTPPPDTQAPSVPAGLSATATSVSQINLSWGASTDNVGVTGYRVERCQGAGCTTFAQIATPSATSYSDTGLQSATAYGYRVRAVDAAGNLSAYSTTASATTQAPAPDTTLPTVNITSPTSASTHGTSSNTMNVSGTAADNVGVTQVTWSNDRGGSGTASGTTSWSVSAMTLQSGANLITVTARDAAGNVSTDALTVTYTPPSGGGGLVAAYNFNEGTGTTLSDLSGNANTGAISGATWSASGKNGGALSFDGVNDRVFVNSSTSLNVTSAVTLQAWVFPTATQLDWRTVVQKEVDAYLLHASNNAGPLRPAAGGTFGGVHHPSMSAPSAIPVNVWTHLAMTYDGAMLRLYVNGTQVATNARTGGIETNNNPLWIGGNSPYGEYFQGRIDDVRVYGRALSASEIQADMNRPVAPP